MNTLPEENFVEPAVRRGISRSTPPPITPASGRTGPPRGIPMSTTSTSPAYSFARPHPVPDLRAVERRRGHAVHGRARHLAGRGVHARRRCRRPPPAPSRPPSRRSPCRPARAAARTRRSRAARRRSRARGAAGRRRTPRGGRRAAWRAAPGHPRPSTRPARPRSTSTSRPAWRSSRAATRPSPPLLPLPQTTVIRPAGARRATTPASPSPARSISCAAGMPRSLIAQRSSSLVSPASSSGSIQRGRLMRGEATVQGAAGYTVAEDLDVGRGWSSSARAIMASCCEGAP